MKAIIAVDENYGIGLNKGLPWPHIKEDMAFFRKTTMGHPIVMGRTTFEGFSKPLPGRKNIVLTSKFFWKTGFDYINTIEDIPQDAIIIGGKTLYVALMPKITEFYVSIIRGSHDADTYMPRNFLDSFKNHELIEKHDTVTILKFTK